MTSDITKARSGAAKELLFDSWFDPIEDGLRANVRGFIETMIEEELTTALSRPRYGRRQDGAEAGVGVIGHRHGRRTRRLTGTFGPTEIAVPSRGRGWHDERMEERGVASLPAPHARCRCADRLDLSGRQRAGRAARSRPCSPRASARTWSAGCGGR